MSVNYKLVEKRNPMKKDAPKKWYAIPNSAKPLEGKAMTRAATENTTTAPIEMEASLELLASFIPQQLQQGHTVKMPGLGTFRLSFKSEGVEDITQFNGGTMIKSPKIVFTPDKELREKVLNGLKFENGGVLQGNISYATLADYKRAKGISGGGSGSGSNPGGGSGDENDNPLG